MKRLIVLLTVGLLLIGTTISVAAQVTSYANELDYEDLDYSENLNKAGSIYMGQVLDALPDATASQAEQAYIRYKFDGQNALYYTKPSVICTQTEYDGEHAVLTLVVEESYYTTSKGKEVLWIPSSARYGSSEAKFEPAPDLGVGSYRVVLDNVAWSPNLVLVIEFSADFEVAASSLNDFVNFAYEQALLLDAQYAEFEVEQNLYLAALEAYEKCRAEWAAYEEACDRYELYLHSLDLYADYLLYQDFLGLVAVYERDLAAYRENQLLWDAYYEACDKYEQYMAYKAEYPLLVQKHEQQMLLAWQQIDLLSYLEQEDPVTGYSFVEMMLDDRVGEMIVSKREQISLVVGNGPVDMIEESTTELERICRAYLALSTDQEKYEFYIREYTALIKHLRQLYDNIQRVYNNNTVYKVLQDEYPDKISSLVRMLGVLYVQNCLFNDSMTLDMTTIVDKRGNQAVGAIVSTTAYPATDPDQAKPFTQWPSAPVSPDSFEVKEFPKTPDHKLQEPVYPSLPTFSVVKNVDEIPKHMEVPTEVSEPEQPAEQPVHPGAAPALPWDSYERDLYGAYCSGKVAQRDTYSTAQTVNLSVVTNYTLKMDEGDRRYLVHFYNTDDEETYLGHSMGVLYGESAVIPPEFASVSKPAYREWAYEFAGWVDENGQPLDLSCMTDDVYAYASYNKVPRICTVIWDVGDVPVVEQYAYGAIPVYVGPTEKSPSAQYIYHDFLGWDKAIVPVTDDVTYTAQYNTTTNRHKVTFVMGDGTSVEKEYAYGWSLSDVVSALPTPYKAPDVQYTYKFIGWSDGAGNFYTDSAQFPKLTGPVTFTSEFEQTLNTYTVTWIVEGESIRTTWKYGDTPMFGATADVVPTKQPEERWEYIFDGWDKELEPVSGNVTYTAKFVPSVRYYYVDFVVGGKTYSVKMEYEQMPVFDGTPRKESDVEFDYVFIGWDKEFVPVRENAVYVAEFDKTVRKYPVTFIVGDSEVVADFAYGTVPKFPQGTPTVPEDSVYGYVFKSWDRELAAVDGSEATYVAQFTPVPLAPGANGEMGKLNVDKDGKFELKLEGVQADLSLVFDKAGREQAEVLEVLFGEAVLVFPKSQIDAFYLMGNGIGSVKLAPVQHEGRVAYQLELLDATGAPVSYLVSELTVKLPYKGAHTADVFRVESDGTQTKLQVQHVDGYLVFRAMEPSTFVLRDRFLIEKAPAENGAIDAMTDAYEGEVVTITADPDQGYHVDSVLVECDGKQIEVTMTDGKYIFVMPRGNVRVTTEFKVVEGGTVAEVVVGVVTALMIVAIGFVVAIVLHRKRSAKI